MGPRRNLGGGGGGCRFASFPRRHRRRLRRQAGRQPTFGAGSDRIGSEGSRGKRRVAGGGERVEGRGGRGTGSTLSITINKSMIFLPSITYFGYPIFGTVLECFFISFYFIFCFAHNFVCCVDIRAKARTALRPSVGPHAEEPGVLLVVPPFGCVSSSRRVHYWVPVLPRRPTQRTSALRSRDSDFCIPGVIAVLVPQVPRMRCFFACEGLSVR